MRAIALGAALLFVLSGCGERSARAPCPAGQLCLEIGNGSEPNSLDPHKMQGTWESRIAMDVLVGLTQNDAAGNAVPGMAERWDTSADGLTWTFYLRAAKWSDGVPVTADDFVFAMRRILDPKTAAEYASLLYFIKGAQPLNEGKAPLTSLGVRAVTPRILEIRLEHPAPYLLELAKHQTMSPVPKHVVERWGDDWSRPEHYVSNGPYQIVSWRLGDKVVVERNPHYWNKEAVCFDRVSFYPTDDRVAAERQVRRGELDMSSPIPPNRIPFLKKDTVMRDYVHTNTYVGVSYLPINSALPKFRDPRVRRALSMAIDREFLVKGVMFDTGRPMAYNLVPPGVANYVSPPNPVWANWTLEKRQAEARRLLAEAGYGPNNPLKVEVKHRAVEAGAVLSSVQNDWAQVGVEASLIGAETQIAYQAYRMRDFEIGDAGWIADYNDAMSFLYLFDSATGAMNYGEYKNPAFDALLANANAEPDVAKRAEYLKQAEVIMIDDAPVIPLYFEMNSNLVSPRVTGFVDNITDNHPTLFMCFKDAKR